MQIRLHLFCKPQLRESDIRQAARYRRSIKSNTFIFNTDLPYGLRHDAYKVKMISDSNLDQLMQFIQSSLASPDTIDEDMLRDEAVAFNELCYEVNAKLASIERLINRGLRDDALVAAGRDGELLTLFEKLDFPDRDLWTELVQAFGLPKPPELNHDAAAKLNMAYATLGDIEGLMNNHRLFALARAPLSARIRILNALALKDRENPLWQSDLVTFQQARLSQMPGEVERAVREGNLESLRAISDELTSSKWWVTIPPKLTAQVKTALTANHKRDLIDQLKAESIRIQNAFAEFDIATGILAAEKIQQLGAEASLMSDDPLVLEMEPALHWVEEQQKAIVAEKRSQSLIDDLELVLDTSTDRTVIERAYSKTKVLGDRLPQPLRQRAIERIASFDMMARRRTMLIYGSAALVLAILGSLAGIWIVQSRQEAVDVQFEKTLLALIENKEWEQANKFVDAQPNSIRSRPVVLAANGQITAALNAEKNRVAEVAEILAQLEADQTAKPNDDLLNRLRPLVKSGPEKLALLKQESIAQKRRLAASEMESKTNRIRFEALTELVTQVLNNDSSNPDQQQNIDNAQTEVATFVDSVSKNSPELANSARMMDRRLKHAADELRLTLRRKSEIEKITKAVGDIESFANKVLNYCQFQPEDPMSEELGKINLRMKEFKTQKAWCELLDHPTFKNMQSVTAKSASDWIASYESTLAEHSNHCIAEYAERKKPYLGKAINIPEAMKTLKALSGSKLLNELWIYRQTYEGRINTYYTSDSLEKMIAKRYQIEYIADFSLITKTKNIGSLYKPEDYQIIKAGQSAFGEEFRLIMQSIREETFTADGYRILLALKKIPGETIDPVFKLFLLRTLLDAILPASQPLTDAFASMRDEMTDDSFEWDTNWLSNDPKDEDVEPAREKASRLLREKLGSWDSRKQRLDASILQMITNDAPSLKWVGWVAKERQEFVAIVNTPSPELDLVVIRHFGEASKIINLGKCQGASMTVSAADAQLAGLPVYAITKPK